MAAIWVGFQTVAAEPPAVYPFASSSERREDAVPGYIELSDGSIHPGQIYLTRDKRLKIADEQSERQREVPLSAVKQIDCTIKKEWLEKEWKFKELAKDEKMYTGRSYPVREYEHTIRLNDGRSISGGLSEIFYVQPIDDNPVKSGASRREIKVEQFILNKRNKGEIGEDLHSLVYIKSIKLGKEAFEEGKQKAAWYEAKGKNKSGK
ncbi:MAG: hypothetical protein ABSE63_14015 [Thermoguttaceae bacterium]